MITALKNEDYELYEELFNYRKQRFNNLLVIEGDLIELGHFTWSDVQKLKVIERRYHINRISERLKKQSEALNH